MEFVLNPIFMSALLGKWLNQTFDLSKKVESVERDLSNGYLFAQVLDSQGYENQLEKYLDDESTFAKVNNFELLRSSFSKLGINLQVKEAREIMLEKPGSATKLLLELKQTLESKKRPAMKETKPATFSLRPPPNRRYIDRTLPKDTRERFIHETVEKMDPQDPAVLKNLGMAIHLRNFQEKKYLNDELGRHVSKSFSII